MQAFAIGADNVTATFEPFALAVISAKVRLSFENDRGRRARTDIDINDGSAHFKRAERRVDLVSR